MTVDASPGVGILPEWGAGRGFVPPAGVITDRRDPSRREEAPRRSTR